MRRYEIVHTNTKKNLASNVKIAHGFLSKLIGLMFREKMEGFNGLIIEGCNSVHTFFMKYAIDVVFLNKRNEVVSVVKNMKPFRMTKIYFSSSKVLELRAGHLPDFVKKKDRLEIKCIN